MLVVEWLYYSKRKLLSDRLTLAIFSLISVSKMCVLSRPMKIVTFLPKSGDSPKRVVDFPRERDTFRNTIMEIVEDFDKQSYNNNGKPWKSSKILRLNRNFFIFHFSSLFFIFSFFHVSSFFHSFQFFAIFSFLHFSFFIFPIFSFLSHFSLIFFHFLGCSKSVFFGLNFVTISLHSSHVKNQFLGPSSGGGTPLGPLFLFFLLFSSRFLSFLLLFIFSFFSLFLFISSFFSFFNVFHFRCSFFLKKKVSSFLCSSISFKIC